MYCVWDSYDPAGLDRVVDLGRSVLVRDIRRCQGCCKGKGKPRRWRAYLFKFSTAKKADCHERCTQVVLDVGTANEGRICFVGWAGRSLGGYLVSVSTIPVWIVSDSDGHWVVPTEMPMYRLRTRGSFLLFDTGFGEMSLQMQLPKLLVDTCPAHCGL